MPPPLSFLFFFLNDPAPTDISPLPLPDALPICSIDLPPPHPLHRRGQDRDGTSRTPGPRVGRGGMTVTAADVRFGADGLAPAIVQDAAEDRKSTRLNSSHLVISYAVFCLKKQKH